MPEGVRTPAEMNVMSPQETGGPDDYGYTWDDSVAMNWIDASGGTDTGINSSTDHVGPVDIGFSFGYYENTYLQLYISRFGFVAFNDDGIYDSQSRIPIPSLPNDVIAPHWVPAYNVNGYVRYLRGGTAPNRWFVVEWNRLDADWGNEYTFEVILHENGDIAFQYGTMTYGGGSRMCEDSGIEDSQGLDGFSITGFCNAIGGNHAVRIYRPAPSARASIRPAHQGRFVHAGETATFEIPLRNLGELGADTYDVTVASTWPVSLYRADGITPLSDTDGDGVADTGSVAQGASTTIVAKVTTPDRVNVVDANTAAVTVRSSIDTGKFKTASLQTGVPTSFAQVYRDNADGAMSLYLAQPGDQSLKKTTDDSHYGYDMAVAEMPNSFAYIWSKGRSVNDVYVREIEYTLLDSDGDATRDVSKLTDHSGATVSTYDYDPAVAVAPNGNIGVLWYRYLYNSSNGTGNYNIFFAILDSAGNPVSGPLNLTNNNVWGDYSDYGVPQFSEPRIAATNDNRFVLAWRRYSRESDGSLSDIYYAVRDANGNPVKGIAKFTTGDDYYNYPALARLSGNRALLAYYANSSISYAVLDSAGNVFKGETPTGGYGYNPDAVQLANDSVLLAWTSWGADLNEISFAVLDGANYNVVAGPTALSNPAAVTGNNYVSVTADRAGRGILTWMDSNSSYRRNLYYALVGSNGTILTDPMIFRTSQATDPYIETSFEGYGNTSWTDESPPVLNAIAAPDDNLTYLIDWEPVSYEADAYIVEEATDSDFADAVEIYSGPSTSYTVNSEGLARYYYRVKVRSSWGDSEWSDAQSVEVHWEEEPNDDAQTQANGPLTCNLSYYGLFPANDIMDYFYFDLSDAGSVELWLTNIAAGQDYDVYLRDANLDLVGSSDESGSVDEHIFIDDLEAGRYYIQVHNYNASDSTQPYHLSLVCHISSEIYLPLVVNNWPPTPGTPVLNSITPPGDNPTYRVSWNPVDRADTYILERATHSDFSDMEELYNGPNTSHTVDSEGIARYYYRVKARNSWGDSGWSNVQSVEVRWEKEPNDNAKTQANGPLASGLTYYGKILPEDLFKDYFFIDLSTSNSVEIELKNIPTGSDYDLVLYNADVQQIALSNEGGNQDERISENNLPPGKYYIQVARSSGGSSQPYHLRVVYE